jgi:hypothetical protein
MQMIASIRPVVLALFLLAGCGSIPPMNFSVPNVGPSTRKIDADLRAVTVSVARPDEKTGDIPLGVESIVPIWRTSLEEALTRMAIFNEDSKRRVSLQAKILKINMPSAGITFPTDVDARYEIIDRSTGTIIYTETVSSNGTTPGDYAFMGLARQRESVNRAVQNNISKFLMSLETIDFNKPMFPAPPRP